MHVAFVEPAFPRNQQEFVRALREVGARVSGIGEMPLDALPTGLRQQLYKYRQVSNVCDAEAMLGAVSSLHAEDPVLRLETTVEAHQTASARVREAVGIPGTSTTTTFLCRDKPAMKEILRKAGVSCAQSIGASSASEVRDFAKRVGFPLILKPRDAAGAAGTTKVNDADALDRAIERAGFERGASIAVEEFIEGHEGFYDTITVDGEVVHEFISHYYPGVLEAMRTRWISPRFVTTNRIDAPGYVEVKEMGKRVIDALGITTSATHMEWFFGPKGLKFSEIGCRPPGVGAWDLYSASNDADVYREWAMAIVHGRPSQTLSRRFAAGIINLRPDRDGTIRGTDGLEEIHRAYGQWLIDEHVAPAGTPTQPVSAGYMANTWMRFKHPDYDELLRLLDRVGETVQVRAG